MNRIDAKFKELRRQGRKAFIAYITAGDPTLAATERLVRALEEAGADIIELGIPFSDPLADGPTIQAASQRALRHHVSLPRIIGLVRRIRAHTDIPIAFMTYFNPILRFGIADFVRESARAGVDGVIVPDLPYEEAEELVRRSRQKDFATVFLLAPTSPVERIRKAARLSTGFIYYVSLTGVTGARKALPRELVSRCRAIKSLTAKPLAVGFGVSTPAQATAVARVSDGVIVGSAIVKVIERHLTDRGLVGHVSNFVKRLARAVHGE
jgi:tryptophan synthase alpha chain